MVAENGNRVRECRLRIETGTETEIGGVQRTEAEELRTESKKTKKNKKQKLIKL
jgi:hypothetical protein